MSGSSKTAQQFWFGLKEIQTNAQHLWSWEVQTTAQEFLIRVLGSSNKCPTDSFTILEKFKQLRKCFGFGSYVVLGLSKNFLRVLISELCKLRQLTNCPVLKSGKFKQLLNTCGLGMRKQLHNKLVWGSSNTCSTFCSWEAQTTDQLFRSWVLINSNNCRTVLDSGLGQFKQLPNICGLGMRKQLHNKLVWGSSNTCSTFCSWEAQTTDQLFRSWVLINSNNCRTVLDSGLGKFKQMPNSFSSEVQADAQILTLGNLKQLQIICVLRKLKRSNNCPILAVLGNSNNRPTV